MTLYPCGFCPQRFESVTDRDIHREHEHPQSVKSAYGYFEAVLRRYDRR